MVLEEAKTDAGIEDTDGIDLLTELLKHFGADEPSEIAAVLLSDIRCIYPEGLYGEEIPPGGAVTLKEISRVL